MKKQILVVAAFFILAGCAVRTNFVQTKRLTTEKIAMIKSGEPARIESWKYSEPLRTALLSGMKRPSSTRMKT